MPGLLKDVTLNPPEFEKTAILARILTGIARLGAGEGRTFTSKASRKALKDVSSGALEDALRTQTAKTIAPKAMQVADIPLRTADRALTEISRGSWGLSPTTRYKILKMVGNNPGALTGVVGGMAPIPMGAEIGIATMGGLSASAKKILRIPVKGDIAMREMDKIMRKRGYEDMVDYLIKTKAKPSPLVPTNRDFLQRHLSSGSSSIV